MDHTVCPGSKFIRQPKPEQFPCPGCGEEVEIWSDEISGRCSACGATVVRDSTMSCIEWCSMARDCVGDDAYESFQDRKAKTIKEQLLSIASEAAENRGVSFRLVERVLFYAENIARSEEADLHVVLAGAVLGEAIGNDPERARKELLKMGYQLEDVEVVCAMLSAGEGGIGEMSSNQSVVFDSRLLARMEELSANGFAGDPENDSDQIKRKLKTKSGSELFRHVLA